MMVRIQPHSIRGDGVSRDSHRQKRFGTRVWRPAGQAEQKTKIFSPDPITLWGLAAFI